MLDNFGQVLNKKHKLENLTADKLLSDLSTNVRGRSVLLFDLIF